MLRELHYNAVPAETVGLLKDFLSLEVLQTAYLVGGTALALYVGHRMSEDLDIFMPKGFDVEALAQEIKALANRTEAEFAETERAKNTLSARIGTTKTDIITFAYPMLAPVQEQDGIRLASLPDIAAMKLSAIVGRGAKKDFWDIHYLLTLVSLPEMLEYFSTKFRTRDTMHVLRALTYFDDAELMPDPIALTPVTWSSVKRDVTNAVQRYARM
ncbi:MAG: nucleotidyl transferase AbiEii/AbiGii toxin family protein [Ignavibacteria bacterium]|nr:nucleotidyl transferase AbiEii/AbiGii toxin family protein [Ignavibacteria bacterium]